VERKSAAVAALVLGAALVGGCTDDNGGGGGDGDGPVELTFWSWVPNIEAAVDVWNAANPDIQVTVTEQAAGDDLVTLVLTAAEAGNAPDLVQVEYQALPTLVSNDVLADVGEYVADASGDFAEGLWQQVTLGTDAVYAVPQDSGPMMFYYRADIFEELGLEPPTTWDAFADAARTVREERPESYLMTFSATDPGWFAGLSQQAGASWWGVSGDAWQVSINDAATLQVAEYWEGLVADDLVDDQPMYTPEWNAALNDGTQIGWVSAVWGPGVLSGNAADTANLWRMAPLPQWTEGDNVTGNWGGSSTGITTDSGNPEAAAEFAVWLNTSPEAVELLVTEGGLYPASASGQAGPALAEPPEFFSEQTDFYELASSIAGTAAGFTWGPNVNVAYDAYRNAFGAAITDRTPFGDAVNEMQQTTIDDMQRQGFTVTG
jgi:multiple sugar transport system substrate-binding protein